MYDLSVSEMSEALQRRACSSEEVTEILLDRIAALDSQLNSLITVDREQALAQAREADQRIQRGDGGPLTGVPLIHKDIFLTQGVKTTCGSKMLSNFVPPFDATVVTRCREAGLVSLGKANMDEFAMGSSNETSYFGPVRNPWDTMRVPGGSSGGSAAAVAARLAPLATGTDTGGSIRQPAALCGITGIKPTYGRVSRWGMIAFASSLDQAGVFARDARDAALLLEAIAGFDGKDSTCVNQAVPAYRFMLEQPLKGLRIGRPEQFFGDGIDPEVRRCIEEAEAVLVELGAEVRPVTLPNLDLSVPTYYVIAPAECSSNLSRFDGVRYGYRCEDPRDLEDMYKRTRSEAFGAEVKRRIMIGTYALSAGYYDAYYLKAQKCRRLITEDFIKAFEEVDVIMGPTSPETAFKLGEKTDDPVKMYLSDINTIAVNLAGLPGLSMPVGFAGGLPVGVQLIGKHFDEGKLLNVAHQYQRETDWHRQVPPGFE
ncbi:MAG: Asp-tRNA(Asn)/Glu-tRNA(Gln) amidotransferase subunit GatA [Pseudomonadota bacterium]|nr:Asp-tRNA(Asn)/Glu-tRNA(Gln) amidotransferase subunit GatA [Pseudomonadota bacterium]